MANPRDVFFVHGRDGQAEDAFRDFLEALDLNPLDWEQLVGFTGKSTPFLGEVLERGFRDIQAAVVLFTPDDVALLHPDLRTARDSDFESRATGQARPNVLFEAGMAFALYPDRTVVIEVGELRPFSDLGGRNVIRFEPTETKLNKIVERLKTAGCAVDDVGADWLDLSRFANLAAFSRRPPSGAATAPGVVIPVDR